MSIYSQIYVECLSKLGFGHPLWRPEPTPHEVEIGDVGVVDVELGCWDRFFSASAEQPKCTDVPDQIKTVNSPFTVKVVRQDQLTYVVCRGRLS